MLGRYHLTCYPGQWAVSIGRFDIAVHVMTLGRYRAAPHIGHLERLQRIYGYLKKYSDAAIRFRAGIPDYFRR